MCTYRSRTHCFQYNNTPASPSTAASSHDVSRFRSLRSMPAHASLSFFWKFSSEAAQVGLHESSSVSFLVSRLGDIKIVVLQFMGSVYAEIQAAGSSSVADAGRMPLKSQEGLVMLNPVSRRAWVRGIIKVMKTTDNDRRISYIFTRREGYVRRM